MSLSQRVTLFQNVYGLYQFACDGKNWRDKKGIKKVSHDGCPASLTRKVCTRPWWLKNWGHSSLTALLTAFCTLISVPEVSQSLNPISSSQRLYDENRSHVEVKETPSQRGYVIAPRSHSWYVVELRLEWRHPEAGSSSSYASCRTIFLNIFLHDSWWPSERSFFNWQK